jgi:hypothetical protein
MRLNDGRGLLLDRLTAPEVVAGFGSFGAELGGEFSD